MKDLILGRQLGIGDTGDKVRLVQEWLCLRDQLVAVDGDFGPATEKAVERFQRQHGVLADRPGTVGENTFARLVEPMTRAMSTRPTLVSLRLGEAIVKTAEQHLACGPREVGGENRGPWVRLYMDGNEGKEWAWCAGFTMYVVEQACRALGAVPQLHKSFSCDVLAFEAARAGLLVGDYQAALLLLRAGDLFLVRGKRPGDWVHVGIVMAVSGDSFDTIEGNTNDDGSREGYKVCARIRSLVGKDFVIWR